MARYSERPLGVFDADLGRVITPADPDAWAAYLRWLAVPGNEPDPMPAEAVRDLDQENARANALQTIAQLERSSLRALRDLVTGDANTRRAAQERLAQIEMDIAALRVHFSAPAGGH